LTRVIHPRPIKFNFSLTLRRIAEPLITRLPNLLILQQPLLHLQHSPLLRVQKPKNHQLIPLNKNPRSLPSQLLHLRKPQTLSPNLTQKVEFKTNGQKKRGICFLSFSTSPINLPKTEIRLFCWRYVWLHRTNHRRPSVLRW
jgi:hypothetical protein